MMPPRGEKTGEDGDNDDEEAEDEEASGQGPKSWD